MMKICNFLQAFSYPTLMKTLLIIPFLGIQLLMAQASCVRPGGRMCDRLNTMVKMVATDSVPSDVAERIYYSKEGEDFKPLVTVFDTASEIKLQKRYGIVNFNETSFNSKKYNFDFSYQFFRVLHDVETCLAGWKVMKDNRGTFDSEMHEAYLFTNAGTDANVVLETTLHSPYQIRVKIY
ncbi:MAG: hypothetical protein U0T73_08930 [Chitinophagales bacterium]